MINYKHSVFDNQIHMKLTKVNDCAKSNSKPWNQKVFSPPINRIVGYYNIKQYFLEIPHIAQVNTAVLGVTSYQIKYSILPAK